MNSGSADAQASAAAAATKPGLGRSAGVVGLAVLASRVLGLVREQVFAGLFGAGRELDAFITAFRIPNLFRDLLAEGALSAAFVTTFSQKLEREGEAAAWRLANLVANALALVVGLVVIAGIVATPWVVGAIAPGFAAIEGKEALTVRLTRIMFPFLLLVALAAVAMGMLNTRNRFGVAASASSFFNLGSIVGGVLAAWWIAPEYIQSVLATGPEGGSPGPPGMGVEGAIVGMAIGTLIGGALQLLVQLPSLWRLNYRWQPRLSFRDPGVRQVLALMGPATIGAAAVQVNVFVNNNFASELGNGPVSWLNVAFRFMQLPIGLFGVAVGTVALPSVSRSAARDDMSAYRSTLTRALRLVFFLTIPAAIGLAVLSREVIGLVYEHGRFTRLDTAMAADALTAYALGLAGYANIKVLVPAFYALDDARTPMTVSCVAIVANLVLNWTTVRVLGLGHVGLALGTSTVAFLNFAILFLVMRRRVGGFPGLGRALAKICLAGVGCGLAAGLSRWTALSFFQGQGPLAYASVVALALPLGGLSYLIIARWLGIEEVAAIAARIGWRSSVRSSD